MHQKFTTLDPKTFVDPGAPVASNVITSHLFGAVVSVGAKAPGHTRVVLFGQVIVREPVAS